MARIFSSVTPPQVSIRSEWPLTNSLDHLDSSGLVQHTCASEEHHISNLWIRWRVDNRSVWSFVVPHDRVEGQRWNWLNRGQRFTEIVGGPLGRCSGQPFLPHRVQ